MKIPPTIRLTKSKNRSWVKLCDKLAASSSPSECREMVAAEVRLALEELANRAEEVDDE